MMPNILIYEAEQILCGRIPGRIWEGGRGGSVLVWGAGIYSARSLFTTWCNTSRADPCVLAEPIFQVIMWSVPLLLGRITQMLSREETHVDASS